MKSWRQTPCRIMSLLGTSQENSLYCVYGTKIPSRGFLDQPCHCEVTPSGMSCLRDLKISINEPLFKNLAANARVDSSDFRESTQWKADRALLVVFGIPGIPVEQVASQIDSSFVAETKSPIFCADDIFTSFFCCHGHHGHLIFQNVWQIKSPRKCPASSKRIPKDAKVNPYQQSFGSLKWGYPRIIQVMDDHFSIETDYFCPFDCFFSSSIVFAAKKQHPFAWGWSPRRAQRAAPASRRSSGHPNAAPVVGNWG